MLGVFAFALAKIIYLILGRDLLLSKFNIIAILVIFMFLGFIYGVSSFARKNSYRKLFKMTWMNFLTDIILSALIAFIGYIFLRYNVGIGIGIKSLIMMFVLLFVLYYLFSSILANYLTPKRSRIKTHKARNAVLFILFNPIFIIIYLWLFGIVAYNSIYIPCNVTIIGIEKNPYTANTLGLGIKDGEKILSIDGNIITSLAEVKRYINSLPSTKQVILETDNNLYYIQTYEIDGKRYMGLLLKQDYCERKYN
jgi:hypothetical protein